MPLAGTRELADLLEGIFLFQFLVVNGHSPLDFQMILVLEHIHYITRLILTDFNGIVFNDIDSAFVPVGLLYLFKRVLISISIKVFIFLCSKMRSTGWIGLEQCFFALFISIAASILNYFHDSSEDLASLGTSIVQIGIYVQEFNNSQRKVFDLLKIS